MNSMDLKTKIEQAVAPELELFNNEYMDSLKSSTRRLQAAIDHLFYSSGKHIRPLLVLLVAKSCGKITDTTITSAVLLELLHTSTLIHDDVIDETKERRGVPSLNAIFDNRVAVLTGDYVLSTALIKAIGTRNLGIIALVSGLGRDLAEGEIKQYETAEELILDEETYLQVIFKKTATLLSACAQCGAISADASSETIDLFRQFGENLGLAFQIKDDIFDYFESMNIGKPTGNDIREGKVTMPLLFALQNGCESKRESMKSIIFNRDFSKENIAALIQFAKDSGGIEYAEKRMDEYYQKAIACLESLPQTDAKDSLLLLAQYIIKRNK